MRFKYQIAKIAKMSKIIILFINYYLKNLIKISNKIVIVNQLVAIIIDSDFHTTVPNTPKMQHTFSNSPDAREKLPIFHRNFEKAAGNATDASGLKLHC